MATQDDSGGDQSGTDTSGSDTGSQTDTGNQQGTDPSHPQTDTSNQQGTDPSHPQTDTSNQQGTDPSHPQTDTSNQQGTDPSGKSEAQRACEAANRPWAETQGGGFCGQFDSITGSPNEETDGQKKEREIAEKTLATTECVQSAAKAAFFAVHPELRGLGIVVKVLTVGSMVTAAGTDLSSGNTEKAAWKIAEIIPTVTKGKLESPGATGAVVTCAKVVLELITK
ncbi:hypothetical protein ABT084_11700 [Streptomyces sp. NPDC002138]|uniref:hypothetical protein n=1 Tax=Streptomyces sp. NPDC002138 TaxID=3154410 RepID=UPI00333453A3